MNKPTRLITFIWVVTILILLTSSFASAYFVTSIFSSIPLLTKSPMLQQIISSFLGVIIWILIMSIISIFIRKRHGNPQTKVFQPIIDAFEKISKGDFNVRLNLETDQIPPTSKLAQSFNTMAEELSAMEDMRQEFISNVSHEIQSPLTSILGFTRVLRNDDLKLEDRHHYLDIIETEGNRISRITDNLLKMASLESRQNIISLQTFPLDKQIRELILACEPQWINKEIEMNVNLEEIEITADKDLLSQVWINFIHNSIKFSSRGGEIEIKAFKKNGTAIVTISDTGLGISKEDQEHIFERFFKADKSRTKSDGGSGLGLSIAKKIVEMHHGNISVKSQIGEGTTFTISLPVNSENHMY
jgi:two-component system, OmpR family, phosphate regulon sensor histidine kinase PhoR